MLGGHCRLETDLHTPINFLLPNPQRRRVPYSLNRLKTYVNCLPDQSHDVFGIIGAVRVVDNDAAYVRLHPVPVAYPRQRWAVAQAVGEGFGRDAVQGQESVVAQLRSVFGEAHLLHSPVERHFRRFDLCEWVLRPFLIADVENGQARAGRGEGAEVGGDGDAGQIASEVGVPALAADGMVQRGVDVGGDVPLGVRLVAVAGTEAVQRPFGDVFAAVAAVLVAGVEGEALGAIKRGQR